MSEKQVWFITGAGRGMGVDFAKAALAAGHHVVATGRTPDAVRAAIGESGDTDGSAGRAAGCHRPGRGRGGRPGGGRAVRTHRCAGQQRRELLRRLLRGADPDADRRPARHRAGRADERHPGGAAGDASAAVRAHRVDLVGGGPVRVRVQLRLQRREVRAGGLDGVPAAGGRAVRDQHHHRQPRLLPHRPADPGLRQLRHPVDRRTTPTGTPNACSGTRT